MRRQGDNNGAADVSQIEDNDRTYTEDNSHVAMVTEHTEDNGPVSMAIEHTKDNINSCPVSMATKKRCNDIGTQTTDKGCGMEQKINMIHICDIITENKLEPKQKEVREKWQQAADAVKEPNGVESAADTLGVPGLKEVVAHDTAKTRR